MTHCFLAQKLIRSLNQYMVVGYGNWLTSTSWKLDSSDFDAQHKVIPDDFYGLCHYYMTKVHSIYRDNEYLSYWYVRIDYHDDNYFLIVPYKNDYGVL